MNTPHDANQEHLRYAEYVLGVLDADARAGVEREIRSDTRAADAVAWWQEHLLPLHEEIPASTPPAHVWTRIQAALEHAPDIAPTASGHTPAKPSRPGLWNSLPLWRGWGLAASVVAIACLLVLFAFPPAPTPLEAPQKTTQVAYMVSNLQQTDGVAAWTATMDVTHARMIVAPSGKVSVPDNRSAELWLIPQGEKPVSVGVLPAGRAAVMHLPDALTARLGPTAVLAVSVEPPGGSSTGQPTGPVIAKGTISAATGSATDAGRNG